MRRLVFLSAVAILAICATSQGSTALACYNCFADASGCATAESGWLTCRAVCSPTTTGSVRCACYFGGGWCEQITVRLQIPDLTLDESSSRDSGESFFETR